MLIGFVGKPSCGKSTFFKAATLANVLIADYPFTTIKPNHGIGYVKIKCIDREFDVQCNPSKGYCIDRERFVPVELIDVAGLVEGASKGKGMGNKFLDDLRQADAFIHIVDVSGETDEKGEKTQGYDVTKDIEMLENELDLWYLGILKKVWKGFSRTLQVEKQDFAKAITKQFSGLKVNEEDVKEVVRKLNCDTSKASQWDDRELRIFANGLRHLTKPMIIAANKVDLPKGKENYEKLLSSFPNLKIIPCSADSELALRQAAKAGLIDYIPGKTDFKILNKLEEKQEQATVKIKENVLDVFDTGTGVQRVLNIVVFELLNHIAVFPVGTSKLTDSKGNILPDCFLVPNSSTALDFAYHIHTDLGDNFIRAINVKTKQVVGKDYELKHRDVIEIITK